MNKIKILGTGLNGLVGSRIVEILKDKYDFQLISRSTGVDITNKELVTDSINKSDAEMVLHLAAKADVDKCEEDKDLGKEGQAWRINVDGTRNVVDACKMFNKKLIHFSTDFVFEGDNTPTNGYSEEDSPNPINWYAQTKYEGEKVVKNTLDNFIIVRPAYPYGKSTAQKLDFVRIIIKKLQEHKEVYGITDHIFVPTYIDDIAIAIDKLIEAKVQGIYHVVGNTALTPYDALLIIADNYNLNKTLIKKTTRAEYFKNKAQRPYNLTLKHDKIDKLGVRMSGFEEGIKLI